MHGSSRSVCCRSSCMCVLLLSAGSGLGPDADRRNLRQGHGRTGAVLPGATVTLTSGVAHPAADRPSLRPAARIAFPNLPIGVYSVTFELAGFKRMVRADVRIQAGFNAEVNGRLELSTRRRDRDRHRREPDRRHALEHARHQLRQGAARGDSVGARSVGHPRADARHGDERAERRRQRLGPAGQLRRARQHQQPAVEPGRRHHHRHGRGIVADLLRLRLVRRNPDHDRRRRRVAGSQRRRDQLRDQERQQPVARAPAASSTPTRRSSRRTRRPKSRRRAAAPAIR